MTITNLGTAALTPSRRIWNVTYHLEMFSQTWCEWDWYASSMSNNQIPGFNHKETTHECIHSRQSVHKLYFFALATKNFLNIWNWTVRSGAERSREQSVHSPHSTLYSNLLLLVEGALLRLYLVAERARNALRLRPNANVAAETAGLRVLDRQVEEGVLA